MIIIIIIIIIIITMLGNAHVLWEVVKVQNVYLDK